MPDIIKKSKEQVGGGGNGRSGSFLKTPSSYVGGGGSGRSGSFGTAGKTGTSRTYGANSGGGGSGRSGSFDQPKKTQGSGVSVGTGSKGSFGSKIASSIKDTASSVVSGTASAVQDEIRRRVDQAAQGSSGGTASHRPSYGQAAAGGSYYDESVTDNGSGDYAELEGPMSYEDYYACLLYTSPSPRD